MELISIDILLFFLGTISGGACVVLFMTLKKKGKRTKHISLYNREDQLNIFLNSLSDFIYIKDKESRFIVANKKNAQVLGLKSTENLIGKTDLAFFPLDLAQKYYKDEQRVIKTGIPLLNEVEMCINEVGDRTYISTSKFPIVNSKKQVIGIVGVGKDVSKLIEYEDKLLKYNEELKVINKELLENQERINEQAEEMMVQSDELKIANEQLTELVYTRDKFFSIIAHDLKNPVNLLRGYSELLIDRYGQISDDKRQNYIKLINGATIQLINLLENLLHWSRMQTGNISFQPQKIRISSLLSENLALFTEHFRNKSITFNCGTINDDLVVYCDKNMIDLVIRNLITNAIKYTKREGNISISCVDKGKEIEFCIADDGIGIDEGMQKNLFGLVKNISRYGTEGEAGTGLGLILCRDFITKNNGSIWCVSQPDEGSKFYFTIPKVID